MSVLETSSRVFIINQIESIHDAERAKELIEAADREFVQPEKQGLSLRNILHVRTPQLDKWLQSGSVIELHLRQREIQNARRYGSIGGAVIGGIIGVGAVFMIISSGPITVPAAMAYLTSMGIVEETGASVIIIPVISQIVSPILASSSLVACAKTGADLGEKATVLPSWFNNLISYVCGGSSVAVIGSQIGPMAANHFKLYCMKNGDIYRKWLQEKARLKFNTDIEKQLRIKDLLGDVSDKLICPICFEFPTFPVTFKGQSYSLECLIREFDHRAHLRQQAVEEGRPEEANAIPLDRIESPLRNGVILRTDLNYDVSYYPRWRDAIRELRTTEVGLISDRMKEFIREQTTLHQNVRAEVIRGLAATILMLPKASEQQKDERRQLKSMFRVLAEDNEQQPL